MVKVNLNDPIRVKLTDQGYEHRAASYNAYIGTIPNRQRRTADYYKATVDSEGYTRFRLWEFIEEFEGYFGVSQPQLFETDIVITNNQ